jgi:hypothetical protein
MVQEAAKTNKDWTPYERSKIKLLYKDGTDDKGREHLSMKRGLLEKVTKTHAILREDGKTTWTAINLLEIVRIEEM